MIDLTLLTFDARQHIYRYDGKPMRSVSKLIEQFTSFDKKREAEKKAAREGIAATEILRQWDQKGYEASARGTRIHELAEALALGQKIKNLYFKNDEELQYALGIRKFFNDYPHLLIDATEVDLCYPEYTIAGRFDFFYRKFDGIYIGDWKTNETIRVTNPYHTKMQPPIDHLDDTKYVHYALQLTLGAVMYEAVHGESVAGQTMVWLKPGEYQVFKMPLLYNEVFAMLEAANA